MGTQIRTTCGYVYGSCAEFIKENEYNHEGDMDKRTDRARLIRNALVGVSSDTVVFLDIEDADAINFTNE